jgi:two-component system, OmpR family, sensor histidine kinase TctE
LTPSLQIRLLYPLLWLWAGSAVLAAISAFWLAGRSTEVAFDRILADDARALASQVRWNASGPIFAMDAGTAASLVYDSLAPSRFAVRTLGGQILVGDARLLPPEVPVEHPSTEPVFQNQTQAKGELRVVGLRIGDRPEQEPVWVLVAEDQTKRQHMRDELARAIFVPATLVGFVILPLLVFGVRYGLQMASKTSESVAARSLNDLSPLPMDDVPQELRPLVTRINDLLARLKATLAHERQFIAEAAHQLRTPVSGIRLLTKDLMRTGQRQPGAPADPEVLAELDAAAHRATHLVQQLLSLARADAGAGGQRQSVDVGALTDAIINKWQRAARDAGKPLVGAPFAGTALNAFVTADPLVLQDALDNLIDNALLYGGPQCQVTVKDSGRDVCIEVFDNGAPLPESVLQRMREPFWRAGDAQRPGSGLGLSIAEKAAVAFGGHLDIDSGPETGGTRVCLCLPRSQPVNI